MEKLESSSIQAGMDKLNSTMTGAVKEISKSLKTISSPLTYINRMIQIQMLMKSPYMLAISLVILAICSIIIYLAIEFFSKNRFRGISFGIFSKLISLNVYIKKFNDQLFEDFRNIYKYVEVSSNGKKDIYFRDSKGHLLKINAFMKKIKEEAGSSDTKTEKQIFSEHLNVIFNPNPNFPTAKSDNVELMSVFEYLYRNEFHEEFNEWLQYKSIWSFVSSSRDDPSSKLLDASVFDDKEMEEIIMKAKDEKFSKVNMVRIREYVQSKVIQKIVKSIFDQILDNVKEKDRLQSQVGGLFSNNESGIDYSSISQRFDETCSLLDAEMKDSVLKRLEELGITNEELEKLSESLSFFVVLERLFERSYIVNSDLLVGLSNVHPVIQKELEKAMKSKESGRAMRIYNACVLAFNDMIYSKVTEDGTTRFLLLNESEAMNLDKSVLVQHINVLFNVHLHRMFLDQIKLANEYMGTFEKEDDFDKEFSVISSGHVSIARMKYLIQDYLKIVKEYNDKSYPDKEDIRNFWEKRVSSFGFEIPGTLERNRPKDGSDSDYAALSRTDRTREGGIFESDLDRLLKKNTHWGLYKEYMKAIFVDLRHPRIPFFQSIIATVRYFIPDPTVVIDNFKKQLEGKEPSRTTNPTNYDFSYKYDPYVNVLAENYTVLSEISSAKFDGLDKMATNSIEKKDEIGITKYVANAEKGISGHGGKASKAAGRSVVAPEHDEPNYSDPERMKDLANSFENPGQISPTQPEDLLAGTIVGSLF